MEDDVPLGKFTWKMGAVVRGRVFLIAATGWKQFGEWEEDVTIRLLLCSETIGPNLLNQGI